MNASTTHQGTVILILSHVINKGVARLFNEVWQECQGQFTVRFLCDNTRGIFERFRDDPRYVRFTTNQLSALGYPGKAQLDYAEQPENRHSHHKKRNFVLGNSELALLWFYREHPHYEHYWLVEYDVRYTGPWPRFFSYFESSRADLLATSLTRYEETPDWPRWKEMDFAGNTIDQTNFIRGFFPIFRISNEALRRLDQDYRAGMNGHYECLMPTILCNAGLAIEDIGGDGGFVRPENIDRFYRSNRTSNSLAPGTFIYRPVFDRPGDLPDMLWHPVKYRPGWRILASRIKRRLLGWISKRHQ